MNRMNVESQMLCALTLACYVTTLAAMFVFTYTLLALTQGATEQHLVNIYLPGGF